MLGGFNLLPGFPLDGGRIFRSVLRAFMSRPKATLVAMWVGRVFAILLGLSGSKLVAAAKKGGLRAAKEVFADRAYEEDGSLVARSKPGAMITDENEAIARVVLMVTERKVKAITGKEIAIEADSICLHGDSPKAVLFAEKISAALKAAGVEIAAIADVIG